MGDFLRWFDHPIWRAYLSRSRLGVTTGMGEVSSAGSSGYTTGIDASISNNVVDNSQYNYFVSFVPPVSDVHSPPGAGDVVGVKILILLPVVHAGGKEIDAGALRFVQITGARNKPPRPYRFYEVFHRPISGK